jgi:hypothetical protein
MPPMRRLLRLVALIVAATLQLAAPLAAYARVATVPDFGDLCSTTKISVRGVPGRGTPPTPAHRHCAQSLCCISGAAGAMAPPPRVAGSPIVSFAGVTHVASAYGVAAANIVAAAPPRGPPSPV